MITEALELVLDKLTCAYGGILMLEVRTMIDMKSHGGLISGLLASNIGKVLLSDKEEWKLTRMSSNRSDGDYFRFATTSVEVEITLIDGNAHYSFKPKRNNA